jgi:cytoskeletal protein CcmA (bactofilin family)
MGIFDKKPEKPARVAEKTSTKNPYDGMIRPRRDCECYIAEGTTVEGKITGNSSVGIDGVINGEMNISSRVVVGENGEIKGEIRADDVLISGKVTGNIEAKNLFEASPPGQVYGDIKADRVVIEEGVFIDGNITMNRSKASTPKKTTPKKEPETKKTEEGKEEEAMETAPLEIK